MVDTVRIRLDFGYDGTDFSGWADQPGRRTVEGELSRALATVLRLPEVRLTTAGRTDAGVHARGAVAHVDLPAPAWEAVPGRSDGEPGEALVARLGGVIPEDVVVSRAQVAPDGFDARFSALNRRYRYRLCDRRELLDPLRRWDTAVHRRVLDIDAADAAARHLLGLHDFAAFCRQREGATTIRTLVEFGWERTEPGLVEVSVVADAFCHSMVRALVGVIVPVGEGRVPVGWPADVMRGARRDPRVQVMPARGLTLERVTYPPDAELAFRSAQARATRCPAEVSERTV